MYKNGKRNGKGKEYDEKGNVTFEGEFLNGMKWNGKGYIDKVLEYEQEMVMEELKNIKEIQEMVLVQFLKENIWMD